MSDIWLFLDDVRPNPDPNAWTLARTYDAAIALIDTGNVTRAKLDHDLGTERTGYDVACYIERAVHDGRIRAPRIDSHSSNPIGRKRILQVAEKIRLSPKTPPAPTHEE